MRILVLVHKSLFIVLPFTKVPIDEQNTFRVGTVGFCYNLLLENSIYIAVDVIGVYFTNYILSKKKKKILSQQSTAIHTNCKPLLD